MLIMIDTTKTANQKRKEAAAARRIEKAQLKQASKIASKIPQVAVPATNEPSGSETLMNGRLDTSLASDSQAAKADSSLD